uniref:BRK domain-containing protein n=1 Tax=Timspurckia oligopyrenoides TaxID=708627 RepID=A0A7S0ZK63_9RHOD|mmetsp:Transcript_7670/g.13905  ORF Transcript_7670/g.13905 Transcript_7670/m.13905 type:complete len:373 (+) Transcript_7670:54-1172(+)
MMDTGSSSSGVIEELKVEDMMLAPEEAAKHITIWNRLECRKIAGNAAPLRRNLARYLAKHPECEVFTGQDKIIRNQMMQSALLNGSGSQIRTGGVGEVLSEHVPIWHTIERRKVTGNAAPLRKNLEAYLMRHPECEEYNGQDKESRGENEAQKKTEKKKLSKREKTTDGNESETELECDMQLESREQPQQITKDQQQAAFLFQQQQQHQQAMFLNQQQIQYFQQQQQNPVQNPFNFSVIGTNHVNIENGGVGSGGITSSDGIPIPGRQNGATTLIPVGYGSTRPMPIYSNMISASHTNENLLGSSLGMSFTGVGMATPSQDLAMLLGNSVGFQNSLENNPHFLSQNMSFSPSNYLAFGNSPQQPFQQHKPPH